MMVKTKESRLKTEVAGTWVFFIEKTYDNPGECQLGREAYFWMLPLSVKKLEKTEKKRKKSKEKKKVKNAKK